MRKRKSTESEKKRRKRKRRLQESVYEAFSGSHTPGKVLAAVYLCRGRGLGEGEERKSRETVRI